MSNGFRLGRIAGVAIHVDWSLAVIFLLVTLSLAGGVFPSWHPDWSAGLVWSTALAAALLFFASVLVHELSHALVGRRFGVEVRRITLFIFGGMAQTEKEAGTWRGELWMAAVGPMTSLVLGAVFIILGGWLAPPGFTLETDDPREALGQLSPTATLLAWLGPVNIILGLFNLVPGFPLDGGRVLRAILWGVTGNLRRATQLASRGGQGFAFLLIFTGVLMVLGVRVPLFGTGLIGGLWLAFIGWFLNNAALMSYRQLLLKESLEEVPVTRLMQHEPEIVSPHVPLQEVVERLFSGGQRVFAVTDAQGRFLGLLGFSEIRVPQENWPQVEAGEAMTGLSRLITVRAEADAYEAMSTMAQHDVNQLPVIDDGHLRGLVRREDIFRWLALYGEADVNELTGGEARRP